MSHEKILAVRSQIRLYKSFNPILYLNFSIFFLHCRVGTKKLLDTKVKKNYKKIGKYFIGVKNCFFRASCFGFIVKGVCPLFLPLEDTVLGHKLVFPLKKSFWVRAFFMCTK